MFGRAFEFTDGTIRLEVHDVIADDEHAIAGYMCRTRKNLVLHISSTASFFVVPRQHSGQPRVPLRYAAVGGPNQVVSASGSPTSVGSAAQATYPSGRISTAGGVGTAPSAGSAHTPTDSASPRP